MKKLTAILLATSLCLFSGATMAKAKAKEFYQDIYAVVDVGKAAISGDFCDRSPAGVGCVMNITSTAWRAGLGYQFNENYGVELQYVNAYKLNLNASSSTETVTVEGSFTGYEASVVGVTPLTTSFAFLGKVGVALLAGKSSLTSTVTGTKTGSADNTAFAFGLGMRYKASKNIAIRLMYENYGDVKFGSSATSISTPLSIISAGLQVGF